MIPSTNLHQFDVWNDGYFAHLPLRYKDGVILNVAAVRMPYEKFAEILEKQAGNYFQGLYYKVPNVELEKGLVRVSNDKEIAYMFDVVELYGRLELYLDHYDMNLSEYLEKAETSVMDESVYKAKFPNKHRYCNEFSEQELVDWAEMEVEYEGSSCHQPRNIDADVGGSSAAGDVGRSSVPDGFSGSTSVDGEHIGDNNEEETDYDSEVDSEYDSDKSIDYLSPGEEGTNVMEEVRAEKVLGQRKKTVAKSGPRKKKVAKSVPTKKASISGSKQKKAGSCGLNRKSLKRSCTSAFARWLGEPELVHNEDAMDAGENIEDEVQVQEEPELVHNEDQIEIELTGTQVEETQTQDVQDEDQIEPVVEDVQHEVQIQEPVVQVRVRRPSERIIKNKLAKNHHGHGSTPDSALDLDVA